MDMDMDLDTQLLNSMLEEIQRDYKDAQISMQNSEQSINNDNDVNLKFQQIQEKLRRLDETVTLQENQVDLMETELIEREILIDEENERNFDKLVWNILEICKIL
ncbi:hypothetical protein O0L34_g7193 [Tuta absoluta]|nr:hypothetical protein O0L34_g7193 [Tuta absoluta]